MLFKKIFTVLTLVALVVSCKKKEVETDNLFKFREYISYTTSGLVSVADPIEISLAKEVAGWEMGKELTENLVTITPHVQGKLMVANNHALLFKPDEHLEPSTEYTVSVKLNDIYKNVPKTFETYTFQFKTITPNFSIVTNDLQSYSKNWQYLEAVIRSADVISLKDAKKLVEAYQSNKKLSIVFNEASEHARMFEFKIDSINRKIDDSEILVKWHGNAIKADNKGENKVMIPGVNNFTIVNVSVIQSPEQCLSINFSDPLKKQQNFDGLVMLQGVKNPKYVVDGNVLKIYPDTKLVGNIQVDVFQGITNSYDVKLKKPFSELIAFEELKPQVRLLTSGTILPNSQELKFNFEAVNLKAVDVRIIKIFEDNVLQFLQDNNLNSTESYTLRQVGRRIAKQTIQLQSAAENTGKWKAYSIDLSKFFKADAGAIYRVEVSFDKTYSLYNCDENAVVSNPDNEEEGYYEDAYYEGDFNESTTPEDDELREEAYWDNLTYRYKNYSYNWREENNPCHNAYYNESKIVSQNLLASNLGVIAKQGTNNAYYFAVTNILTTNPEAGATVKLYNFQQQELARAVTDNDGLILIDLNKNAAFAIVSKGKNTTYIKFGDGNSLSLSKFDVSGTKLERGLKGYIYGERGVWRPGDTLHLTFMLNDFANPLPKGHPVKMEITDPYGKLVYKNITTNNLNNFYKFTVTTAPEDKTGNYVAKVSLGGATFYKDLKIETVKPNRLKIKVDFENDMLTSKDPLKGTLDVKWLHGAPEKT